MICPSQNGRYIMRPWVTALSYSGGTGSTAILWAVLLGELARPQNFIVINADPGMEGRRVYEHVAMMERECVAAGIPFIRVKRDLYAEILALKASGATRFDNPPFWTLNRETGSVGQLMQKCTKTYKIAEMDRAVRVWMSENIGVPMNNQRLGSDSVNRWIGFTADEVHRIKEDRKEFEVCNYPLVEMGIDRANLPGLFLRWGKPMPPRSVCRACFANDVSFFKGMHDDEPADFEQACKVDDEIRDLSCIGIADECYVSSVCIPLRVLAANGFNLTAAQKEQDAVRCHSGHCFT